MPDDTTTNARSARYRTIHPLATLSGWRGFTYRQTWLWLYQRGWCSDHCTSIFEIASPDVDRILTAAGVRRFFPADLSPSCIHASRQNLLPDL